MISITPQVFQKTNNNNKLSIKEIIIYTTIKKIFVNHE